MNVFEFVGHIKKPTKRSDIIKKTFNGSEYLSLGIQQSETNIGYARMYSEQIYNNTILTKFYNSKSLQSVAYEDRFKESIVSQVANFYQYKIIYNNKIKIFICKNDFIECAYNMITKLPENTIYKVKGDYTRSFCNDRYYNNFNIHTIIVDNQAKLELKLKLELFYNYESLDETDKKNKFVLNAYINQYVPECKEFKYIPIQTQFITNTFDFTNAKDVEIIKHRKSNLNPLPKEGYVKSIWETTYFKGAILTPPPLESLPKDIQFEINNAGRNINEYMSKLINKSEEIINLVRPDNTGTQNGAVYCPIKCSKEEFENQIYRIKTENNDIEIKSLDNLAVEEANINPFN